ncbi:MAG: ferredoxin [Jatrophihabitans sp.]
MREIPTGLPSRPRSQVQCDACGLAVLVGKTSWQQTSVQWPPDATTTCLELRTVDGTSVDDRLHGCRALRRSIEKAALRGAIDIPD